MGKLRLRRASHLPRPYSWPRAVLQNIPVDFKSRAKNKRHRYVCDKAPPLCMWQTLSHSRVPVSSQKLLETNVNSATGLPRNLKLSILHQAEACLV